MDKYPYSVDRSSTTKTAGHPSPLRCAPE